MGLRMGYIYFLIDSIAYGNAKALPLPFLIPNFRIKYYFKIITNNVLSSCIIFISILNIL